MRWFESLMCVETCFVMGFSHRATSFPIASIGVFMVATNGCNGTGVFFYMIWVCSRKQRCHRIDLMLFVDICIRLCVVVDLVF